MAEGVQDKEDKEAQDFCSQFLSNAQENERLISYMKETLTDLEKGYPNMYVTFLHVTGSPNATSVVSFSGATCDVEPVGPDDQEEEYIAPIGSFFLIGCKILDGFLETNTLPTEKKHLKALQCLLQFLLSDHSELIKKTAEKESESAKAIRFAEHLLMPLVDEKTYVIDRAPGSCFARCCNIEHPLNCSYGDTSFGLPAGWHGPADIFIMSRDRDGLPVYIGESDDDDVSVSSVEIKQGRKFPGDSAHQMIAETIVFSFLEHKQNFGKLKHYLIPSVGICSGQLVVHMYDCQADVLMGTRSLDLALGNTVDVRVVIVLWLTLNYRLFCSGLPDEYKSGEFKAEFHNFLGPDYLKQYQNDVTRPCHLNRRKRSYDFTARSLPPLPKKKLEKDHYRKIPLEKLL